MRWDFYRFLYDFFVGDFNDSTQDVRNPNNTTERIRSSANNNIIFNNIISTEQSTFIDIGCNLQNNSENLILNKKKLKKEIVDFFKDIQDPLTGETIDLKKIQYIFQCARCSVFYLKESYEFLVTKNQGQCVCCRSYNIVPFQFDKKSLEFKRFELKIDEVNLENLYLHVGKSVKFQGKIIKILESRRGDYALMFEDKPWVEGFKLIVFYSLMKPGKGLEREFLKSLVGKNLTVRGLLKYHEIYGYEILIFKRSMILKIQ